MRILLALGVDLLLVPAAAAADDASLEQTWKQFSELSDNANKLFEQIA